MKKKYKSLFAMALAVIMLLSVTAPAFAATKDNVKQYKNMLVFGDSIACGYGLPSLKNCAIAEGTYPDLLAKAVGAENAVSAAFCGCSVIHVMYMLGVEIDENELAAAKAMFAGIPAAAGWSLPDKLVREGIVEKVKNADLITLAIGSNDVSTFPKAAGEVAYNEAVANGAGTAEAIEAFASGLMPVLESGFKLFFNGYEQVLERIRELNPSATVVLVGAYNPLMNIKFTSDEEKYAVGNVFSAAVDAENAQLISWAQKYKCLYADTTDIGSYFEGGPFIKDGGINTELVDRPLFAHPNYDQHAMIADDILKVLPAVEKKLFLPKNGEVRFEQNGVDLGKFELEFKGFGWTVKDTETGLYVGINGESDKPATWFYDGGFFTIGTVKKDSRFGFSYLTFVKRYLTADESGALAIAGSRSKMTMFVET